MLKSVLQTAHGVALDTIKYFTAKPGVFTDPDVLVTAPVGSIHGTFKSVTRTGAGTTTIVAPVMNGSLIITDIVVTGEKQAASDVTLQFTDGAQTIVLLNPFSTDAPPTLSVSFVGRVQGWKDAQLDMVTVGIADAQILVCYTKLPVGLPFAEWDALR